MFFETYDEAYDFGVAKFGSRFEIKYHADDRRNCYQVIPTI